MTVDYKQVAIDKAQSLIDLIPREWILERIPSADEEPNVNTFLDRILPTKEKEITNKNIQQLLDLQLNGTLTAIEIATAFAHRAAMVHQLTNCCSEIFFERGFERARQLDEYFKEHKKLSGKLHGIPISLKDQINLPGITTALGYIAPHMSEEFQKKITHRPSLQNTSLIAKILQDEGAVFYLKTTVPMAMLGGETSSNLGITYNSLDRHTSCGGSSGGEGSLIAAGGSIVGIGTDIGGSIRTPSYVHGLYGLRACSNRFPYLDIANSYPNQIAVCSVVGPICKNIEDMLYMSKLVLSDEKCGLDPRRVPLPWNNELVERAFDEKVKLGFLKSDGEILPHPPIIRNIELLQKKLTVSNEFECKKLNEHNLPVKISAVGELLLSLYNCDNYEEIESFCKLSGEPLPEMFERCFKKPGRVDSVSDFCDKAGLKYQYQYLFDEYFRQNDVDCLILPTYSTVSWIEGEAEKISNYYTRSVNVLDYTAMTFPVGVVDENDVAYERTDFTNKLDESNWKYYQLEQNIGKVVSVQIICKRYKEEQCIAIVKKITELLKN